MNTVNKNSLEKYVDSVLNNELPVFIPELLSCLSNPEFKYWFENKFCKYTRKIDHEDLSVLVKSINDCLEGKHGVDAIAETIDDLEAKLVDAKHAYAHRACPFQVGDVGTMVSYVHIGKRAMISSIEYSRGFKIHHGWIAHITIIKKDGELSEVNARFTDEACFELDSTEEA